jgi:hypothetical protein
MEDWNINWTSWVLSNTHAEIKGLTYENDSLEWLLAAHEMWLNNSDFGWKQKAKMERSTIVFEGNAQWSRNAKMKLKGNKVEFDCSDGEYGPIEFDLEILLGAILKHLSSNEGSNSSR